MICWSKLLAILYQQKAKERSVGEEMDRTISPLSQKLFDIVSYSGTVNYDAPNYSVTFRNMSDLDMKSFFPYQVLSVKEEYQSRDVSRYTLTFRSDLPVLRDLFVLQQRKLRPFSPLYDQDTNVYGEKVSFPIGLQAFPTSSLTFLPTRSAPTSLFQLLPEELKHKIITYGTPEDGEGLEVLLAPDEKYSLQEAYNIDPSFSLEELKRALTRRMEHANRTGYLFKYLQQLMTLESVTIWSDDSIDESQKTIYQFQVVAKHPIRIESYLGFIDEVDECWVTHEEDNYIYEGEMSDIGTPTLIGKVLAKLNIVAQLTSIGYSSPRPYYNESFLLEKGWLTLEKN